MIDEASRTEVSAPEHEVAIIGAGFSGLGMGSALRRAGIEDFVILERADDIGGTWRDNTYPGIGVDIPSYAYQFSYDLRPEWTRVFPKGAEVKAYIDRYASERELRPHIRLGTEVSERQWDEEGKFWRLRINGGSEEVTARFVISAIGPFVDPKPSGIEGVEDFEGEVIHSARWDHEADLAGKRVAIVGTGASAVQIVPLVAREAARLDVYQRTPIWIFPKFDPKIPKPLQRLLERVPFAQRLLHRVVSEVVEFILIRGALNYTRIPFAIRGIEAHCKAFLRSQVRDPETRRKLTPDYGFGCKRPSISNHYLRAFNRENVELVTDPIERVTAKGVRTADGREREVDTLVLATGFRLQFDPENYRRTPVQGRDDFDLADHYQRHRLKAYESISIPGLPNHFMIFGPYGWTGASWHVLVETASRHIVRVLAEARRRGATEVEVTPEATDRYHEMVLARMSRSLWGASNCETSNSYYFDHHGDIPYVRPTTSREAHRASRTFPLDDYRFGPAVEAAGNGKPAAADAAGTVTRD
jgi:cation diffusion facilitator CzcD-associated flavoprotein CzcO